MKVHSKDSENEINNKEEFLINSERNIYDGQWKNSKKHGFGKETTIKGYKYAGKWF